MNKCLSLVHLTSRIGPQSSGSDESTSWFLRYPKPDLDPPGTKSVSGRLNLYSGDTVFCIEPQLPGRQPLPQDTSAEASHKPVSTELKLAALSRQAALRGARLGRVT